MEGGQRERVALFLDYGSVSAALKGNDQNHPRPGEIIRPVVEEFAKLGDLVHRYAYADWSRMPHDMVHQVEALGFTPVFALTRARYRKNGMESGVRKAVPLALALDALELALTDGTPLKFVFVTGDREYYEVVERLRRNDVPVVLAAFERSLSVDVVEISGVEPVFLDNILGPPKSPAPGQEKRIDWAPFIKLLLSLELRYGYVGYRGLKDKLDASVGCGNSEYERRRFMDMATQQEIITLEKMTNPKNPEFPLTVCRLNRKNPVVQNILRSSLKIG